MVILTDASQSDPDPRRLPLTLSARKAMDVVSVYLDVGSFNAAGEICGVDPKKVTQIVAAHEAGGLEEGGTVVADWWRRTPMWCGTWWPGG